MNVDDKDDDTSVDHLAKYAYLASDNPQDQSFAAADNSQYALAGQQSAPSQAPGKPQQGSPRRPVAAPVKRTGDKVKPNDPCICGSGKKYKKCCGAKH
jgi:preprotein translocase subunit SecA